MGNYIVIILLSFGAGIWFDSLIAGNPIKQEDKKDCGWQDDYQKALKDCVKDGSRSYDCVHWMNGGGKPKPSPSPSPTPTEDPVNDNWKKFMDKNQDDE